MIPYKLMIAAICSVFLSVCSVPMKEDDEAGKTTDDQLPKDNMTYTNTPPLNNAFGIWSGGLSAAEIEKYPFVKGWYAVYRWDKLEPEKDKFDWSYFDNELMLAASHNLDIGFMVWVGPHSPEWLYSNGVPKVITDTKKRLNGFPYYLSEAYKERYYNMMKAVGEHIEKLPDHVRNKILFWMSAEGSTGDITPYKGKPQDAQYEIAEQQWFDYKKDVWKYMYDFGAKTNPRISILINQGNDGRYLDWILANYPKAWLKVGNISHTYQFNGEVEYYNRMQRLVQRTAQDSTVNRMRGEIAMNSDWFYKNESWNMYALLTSSLHFGLDIFNSRAQFINNPNDISTFEFFNFYAGQKNASTSPGAFCVLRDGLDAADTKRFPEDKYGPLINKDRQLAFEELVQKKDVAVKSKNINSDEDDDDTADDESQKMSDIKNDYLSPVRVGKILSEYSTYGAKRGDIKTAVSDDGNFSESTEETKTENPAQNFTKRELKKLNRKELRKKDITHKTDELPPTGTVNKSGKYVTAYQKAREATMVINDIGVNIIPDNYYKFLVQYSPNTTSRGYWRVGPADQPYGRFARGFDARQNMKEMFFALDNNFFTGSSTAKNVSIKIIYLDKGNGSWALHYNNGSKKEAYRITCKNTGRWMTKTADINDAVFTHKLEHGCDVSIQYLSGDNTIFNSIEIIRK